MQERWRALPVCTAHCMHACCRNRLLTSPLLCRQQGWLWRPFAVLERSSLVQAALPRFAVSLLAQVQLNQ